MLAIKRLAGALALIVAAAWATMAPAADRDTLRAFLETTGFDVAITSMQQEAASSPGLGGQEAEDFGSQYTRLAETVFDPELMLGRAIDMMQAIMPDELVTHGAAFYASDLGQKLVAVENASQNAGLDSRRAEGQAILEDLLQSNPGRVDDYRAMMDAIGGIDASVRAILEVQLRYLLAAQAAGTLDLGYSEAELRELMDEQAPAVRRDVEIYSIVGAAYTYRDISDADVAAYRAALEAPEMRQVYEILNAIQYEVMAERYEALATELAKLAPETAL